MHTASHAQSHPEKLAFIMAGSGKSMTYQVLEQRSNQLAHFLRAEGLIRLDHYAVFMENNWHYVESSAAAERSGLYVTCINSWLTPEELAYIINNSESKILITSQAKLDIALQALELCPQVTRCLVVGGGENLPQSCVDFDAAVSGFPVTPIDDESLGTSMLYSSGTTGRPKGILRPLPEQPPAEPLPLHVFLQGLWGYQHDMIYLSPAPLYHSAPHAAVSLAIRTGGTVIIMEKFDAEQYLALIEKHQVSHSQLVPTMFGRMLKLPEAQRNAYDLSSLKTAIHAAAPCPRQVKEQMIEWWGPIIHEYYGATEGLGFTACNSEEWLAHPGSVGKVLLGILHIVDEHGNPATPGNPGEIWFETATEFEYFNDAERTAQARSADGKLSTVGDIGYVDEDGYLYLTDRATFMIISGGVNIYPQEAENLLITHADVMDAAVFGVPNEDLGEEVKAVVQLVKPAANPEEMAESLIAFCRDNLAHLKCPRTIDFTDELPRLPTGKLYKKGLRDAYWPNKTKV